MCPALFFQKEGDRTLLVQLPCARRLHHPFLSLHSQSASLAHAHQLVYETEAGRGYSCRWQFKSQTLTLLPTAPSDRCVCSPGVRRERRGGTGGTLRAPESEDAVVGGDPGGWEAFSGCPTLSSSPTPCLPSSRPSRHTPPGHEHSTALGSELRGLLCRV